MIKYGNIEFNANEHIIYYLNKLQFFNSNFYKPNF